MSFGKGSNTTTQQTSTAPNPQAMQLYQDLLTRAQGVSNTPYQAYSGEMVAPVNAQQNMGIGNINQYAGFAMPYVQQAAGYAGQAAAPLTANDVNQFMSPYTQQVVDATSRQFANMNAQQNSQVVGNAAAQGALGGDRVGVAQANLAAQQQLQQAPVIAGLYSQGYQNAVNNALAARGQSANAAGMLGNLGIAGQQAGLSGAGAQIGAGSLQQQTQQAMDTAAMQQWLQQQAYPFQTTQWLAGLGTGVGSQMGGTSTGSTTTPPPNPWSQLLGAGITAAGFFLKDGGRVAGVHGFADGGDVPSTPWAGGRGYVPGIGLTRGAGPPRASAPKPYDASSGANKMVSDAMSLAKAFRNSQSGSPTNILPFSYTPTGVGEIMPSATASILPPIYRDGGGVNRDPNGIYVPRGYDDGGVVTQAGFGTGSIVPDYPEEPVYSFSDRAAPVQQAISGGVFDPQSNNYTDFAAAPLGEPVEVASAPSAGVALPPEITQGTSAAMVSPHDTSGVMGYDSSAAGAPTAGLAVTPQGAAETAAKSGFFNLSDNARTALIAAGLGMMASRSPNLGTAIGEGGLQGLQAYSSAKKNELAQRQAEQKMGLERERIGLEAKRLSQMADQFAKEHGLKQQGLAETIRQHNVSQMQPVKIGVDALGREIYGIRDPQSGQIRVIDPKTGQIMQPGATTIAPSSAPTSVSSEESIPATAQMASGEGGRNEEYLKSLAEIDPELPGLVKKIADYDTNPKNLSIKGGHREKILGMVAKYDPSYNDALYPARAAAIKEFTSGGPNSPAGTITAGNTAIQHLGQMADLSEKLGGTNNAWILNKPLNWLNANEKEWKNDPTMRQYKSALDKYVEEVVKFYRGIGGAESDIKRAIDNLTVAQSPEARAAAIYQESHLMQSKISALQDRWKTAVGGFGGWQAALRRAGVDDFPIVQKKSQEALDTIEKLHGRHGLPAPRSTNVPQRPTSVPAGSAYNPARKLWRTPQGVILNENGEPVQ